MIGRSAMVRRAARVVGRLATLSLAGGCVGPPPPVAPLPPGGIHVLFVGNSLTYTNDLPGTVAALGMSVGDTIRVSSAVGPDLALIDHLNGASDALAQLRLGGWNFVVLQEGPSALPVDQDSLTLWTALFNPYIRAGGGRPALLMVWPPNTRLTAFDSVRAAYENAARAVGGVFMPAGEAWLGAWAADSTLRLYSDDGYHPAPLGTYLAALVIYERVTGHDARNLPGIAVVAGNVLDVPAATVRLAQSAAHTANAQFQ